MKKCEQNACQINDRQLYVYINQLRLRHLILEQACLIWYEFYLSRSVTLNRIHSEF